MVALYSLRRVSYRRISIRSAETGIIASGHTDACAELGRRRRCHDVDRQAYVLQ